MPTIPKKVVLNANSMDILNAVRNDLGGFYQSVVPIADGTTENLRVVGSAIMGDNQLQNAFLSALVNRIGRVILTNKLYENPWARFKKGLLEYGETVEEIFVNIAKPHQFNPNKAESEVFKREIPDVRAEFHPMNYQKFYKVTVSNEQLRQAFLSASGVTDLIGKIIDSLYTGANYDEFLTMKYMIGRMALANRIVPRVIPEVQLGNQNPKEAVIVFKAISNDLTYLTSDFNYAKVKTKSDKRDQYLITDSSLDAYIDVDVLASAFNMEKAEFMGHRVQVDGFGKVDNERLTELFADDTSFQPFTEEELAKLKTIRAMIVDRDWFMIFDNFMGMTEQYNGQGLYWNYWYHAWKTFSVSPFSNAVLFTEVQPTVLSVDLTPLTPTVKKGSATKFTADVKVEGFASTQVTWELTGALSPKTTLDEYGILNVGADETAVSLTVKATSVGNKLKTAETTVTLQE